MSGNDRVKFWLLLLGVAAAAVYSFWYAFKAWRENRVVADTPTSRVRSAAQGYVELTGHGVMPPHKETIAPLTGKPCTWWRYKIEERRSSGRSRGWTKVDGGTSEEPFVLDDGTGQCLIDPRGAEVFPVSKDVWYGSTEWPEVRIPDGTGLFGKLADVLLSGGHYRYTEYRLQPNETVCALGSYRSIGGVGVDDPEVAVAALLHDWKQDQKTLLARFDRNHDGVLDAGEWDQARAAAHNRSSSAWWFSRYRLGCPSCRSPRTAARSCCRPRTAWRWLGACAATPPRRSPHAWAARPPSSGWRHGSDRIVE